MLVSIAVTRPAELSANEASRRARFEALFVAHGAAVFAFARRRTSRSMAEDVVSDTFLVAWRRLDAIPDRSLPWLLGVARRALANRRRADRRQAALSTRVKLAARDDDGFQAGELEVSSVLAALATLPPAERDAITLLAWEGLTPQDAAIVLGCSRATFYVRVHRARRKLSRGRDTGPESTTAKEVG
jgi:RNA polymerase sigma-70 factor (ECF subfamily)